MKVCFVAAGPRTWASSRLRCYWPARYMNAQVVPYATVTSEGLPPANVYVWQKQVDMFLVQRQAQAQHWWDVSEPVWWFDPEHSQEIVSRVSGVVANNKALAQEFLYWQGVPCHVIPDRVELSYYNRQRQHTAVSPVRLIWFGAVINRVALAAAWPNLLRLVASGCDIELTVMDDRPDLPLRFGQDVRVYHVYWAWEQEVEVLASHDIALLPPIPGPWGNVRSNAKALAAQACGLPVTSGLDYAELYHLVSSPSTRARLGQQGYEEVVTRWSAAQSAAEWLALLLAHRLEKSSTPDP